MGRRLATAAPPISQALNIRSQTLSNLQDLDYGEWQGVTHEAARHKAPAHTTTLLILKDWTRLTHGPFG